MKITIEIDTKLLTPRQMESLVHLTTGQSPTITEVELPPLQDTHSIRNAGLTNRAVSALTRAKILTIGDLRKLDRAALERIPRMGPKTINLILERLAE